MNIIFDKEKNTTENTMDMIPQFQTLPLHLCLKIFNMVPRPDYIYQLINIRECLEDYKAGRCVSSTNLEGEKWGNFTYKDFALHKIRQKRELNREK